MLSQTRHVRKLALFFSLSLARTHTGTEGLAHKLHGTEQLTQSLTVLTKAACQLAQRREVHARFVMWDVAQLQARLHAREKCGEPPAHKSRASLIAPAAAQPLG